MIIVPDTRDPLAQIVVFLLQTVILRVEPVFLAAQPPHVQGTALADNHSQGRQDNERTEQIYGPASRQA